MKRYILKRIFRALICLIGVTIIIFFLTRLSGDPVLLMVPPEATKADIELMRKTLGLDKPLYEQYWTFISKAVRGDKKLGKLYTIEGQPPDLANLPPGCNFASRCSQAMEICEKESPDQSVVGDGHTVSCWLTDPKRI